MLDKFIDNMLIDHPKLTFLLILTVPGVLIAYFLDLETQFVVSVVLLVIANSFRDNADDNSLVIFLIIWLGLGIAIGNGISFIENSYKDAQPRVYNVDHTKTPYNQ